ncbi:hypothetical protein MTR67_036959 [Solanum verrucosum]|uniref:Uncharacterized protein n=1 Tax=Solanum verrucosum TaxID=315347 RepID=A0AAF0UDR0_SOLVR|nr:hypothetical protein MTR67_036959 [Solanum verrucosum]
MAYNARIVLQPWRTFFNFIFMQEQSSPLTILGFFFTIFLNFIQLKYQGTDPFTTHPKTMRISVTSFLLYSLIYAIKHRFSSHLIYRNFSDLVHNVMIFFTSLSLASTASVLFTYPVSHVVFSLCFLLSGGEMFFWVFKKIMQKFEDSEITVWNYLRRRMNMGFEQRFSLPI